MDPIELDPNYSTKEIPGKCLKCLAEQKLNQCLFELLRVGEGNEDLERRYEALVSFLKSPESKALRDESERYLSEGKQVTVRIHFEKGKTKYELEVE